MGSAVPAAAQGSATRSKALADATHRAVITLDRGPVACCGPAPGAAVRLCRLYRIEDHMLIDHLVYAAPDLAAAVADLEERFGVRA